MGRTAGATAKAARAERAERFRRIYAAVGAIPPGSVASYGEIAARAGLARGARLVGRALGECPARVPWHRVLGAGGRISLPRGSTSYAKQVRLLEREGVEVRDGRVAARYFRRQSEDLDALLWGPDGLPALRREKRR